jgi:hypothetical protein
VPARDSPRAAAVLSDFLRKYGGNAAGDFSDIAVAAELSAQLLLSKEPHHPNRLEVYHARRQKSKKGAKRKGGFRRGFLPGFSGVPGFIDLRDILCYPFSRCGNRFQENGRQSCYSNREPVNP